MTRDEIHALMPEPREDWESLEEGDLILVTKKPNFHGWDTWHWKVSRITSPLNYDGHTFVFATMVMDGEFDDDEPYGDPDWNEVFWHITELAKERKLPPEIAALVGQHMDKL